MKWNVIIFSKNVAEGFQRRRLKCEKLTDDRRRTPQGELIKIVGEIHGIRVICFSME
jgi:hypothetical protein